MDLSNYNLTPSSKKAIEDSIDIAEKFGHLKVIDLHLMMSILQFDHANIDHVLEYNDLIKEGLKKGVGYALINYKEPRRKKAIFAPEITEILDNAKSKSLKFKDNYIGIDHILLSILSTREEVGDFLISLDVDLKKLIKDFESCISKGFERISAQQQINPSIKPQETNEIESCCENLNQKILERGTFEIFGRDKEIERAFEILLRKNKSNIIFVGEAGVGKTAVVEGMAEKIVQRECPDLLLHKEILTLDITSVLSGTVFRGQMEEKMKNIIKHASDNPHLILFIDEVHTIIGSGSSEGSLDLANILKPALSRGEISCIGATTEEEYKRYFKKDQALDRRFENITVDEPSSEDTKALLMKAKTSYEDYHQVKYSESCINLIIDLCSKYTPEKKFPDKAFDILDESGAKTKKINIIRPQEAKDMEDKFKDQDFVNSKAFSKHQQKYEKILQNWGKKLEKCTFSVDSEVIYDIFALKLNTTPENLKNGSNIRVKGTIGF